MKIENHYDFRKRMLQVHAKNIRDFSQQPTAQEMQLQDGVAIVVAPDADEVVLTAAKDFLDYLFTSMGLSAMLRQGSALTPNSIRLSLAADSGVDLGNANGRRGFRIDTDTDAVAIYGFDSRGIAQALYYLEDSMTFRHAPLLIKGTVYRKPLYETQMVQSGYRKHTFPNEYLAIIAHEGRNAVLLDVTADDLPPDGKKDINDLIYRAAKYGIDVYAYSKLKSDFHPDDPGAEAYYESTYGRLFKYCPGLKGITLVGEAVEFPSKDPHVTGRHYYDNVVDGIPTGKVSPGWYPCMDLPQWLSMIKKIINRYSPDADIVLWSYNWGNKPEEDRVKLIEALPEGISLQATFEMFENFEIEGNNEIIADYSLFFEGYGKYFESEAIAAKKRGIRLYSMTNTAGVTWDFGVIGYEPFPYQWIKRYKAMQEAHEKWGLCGLMESHDYGLYPSFISKLSKWAFFGTDESMESILERIIRSEYGEAAAPKVLSALKAWSDSITYTVPSNADQYGAFRVGPSYPFCLYRHINLPASPNSEAGNGIVFPDYMAEDDGNVAMTSVRVPGEIRSLEKMKALLEQGLAELETIECKNEKLEELINLGKFLRCSVITGIHAKHWHLLKCSMRYEQNTTKLSQILDSIESLLLQEKANAESAIPLVQRDSRLGWNTCMEYMCDEDHIRWKLRQVDYVLKTELPTARGSLAHSLQTEPIG